MSDGSSTRGLEEFIPDEIVAVCAPRIRDPKFRRAIENLKSARDLEHLPLIWRERGAGTRAMVEQVLKERLLVRASIRDNTERKSYRAGLA